MTYFFLILAGINTLIYLYLAVNGVKVSAWAASAMAVCWFLTEIQRLECK